MEVFEKFEIGEVLDVAGRQVIGFRLKSFGLERLMFGVSRSCLAEKRGKGKYSYGQIPLYQSLWVTGGVGYIWHQIGTVHIHQLHRGRGGKCEIGFLPGFLDPRRAVSPVPT